MSDKLVSETAQHFISQYVGESRESLTNILINVEQETMKWTWQNVRDTVRGLRDAGERTPDEILQIILGEWEGEW